ncbi:MULTISPECIES: amidohydrolase family protein [Roseobacteraceae]|uniref:Amidohydrolase n=1 Tax=Pseudosulfitobacter pseudonitzschiae TaxID=1402135 RepID=A0A221K5L4_9RHOB|nr:MULTISPECIES: amidohydrolase [Roseobacteraceae]ASM74298.1 amidohydrolase [Pseudosulfitobacter pseudonitzschiae]
MTVERITDTHCHIIDRTVLDYPWLSDAPALDRDWSIETYTQEARQAGITRTLHMEVDVATDQIDNETDYIAGLADRQESLICGIIAACRPENNDFGDQIAAAQAHPLVKGFRRPLHVVPDALSEQPLFRDNIRQLATAGLPFDICVTARQLPQAQRLVDAAPQTQFILDHCGVPDIAGAGWNSWAAEITALSQRDNLSVKISGLPAYAQAGWTARDLERWVMHVVEQFTPARCVWGGDWPVCTLGGSLTDWVSATRSILAKLSTQERAAILDENATHIWGLT